MCTLSIGAVMSVSAAGVLGAQLPARELPLVTSKEKASCDMTRATATALVDVWSRIRASLEQAEATQKGKTLAFELYQFERTLDPGGRIVRRLSQRTRSGNAFTSFTPRDADSLAAQGYVIEDEAGATFYAPSASTLLSDPFLRTHCFQLRPSRESGNTSVVVDFTPATGTVSARKFVDVAGAYWVDRMTGRLDSVQFRYLGLPPFVEVAQASGTVAFAQLSNGPVFVSAWSVRMPRIGEGPRRSDDNLRRTTYSTEKRVVAEVQEEGGVVLSASVAGTPSSVASYHANLPHVDVQLEAPPTWIASARVEVQGTGLSQPFDSTGGTILRVPPGRYALDLRLPFGSTAPLPLEGSVDTFDEKVRPLRMPDQQKLMRHVCGEEKNSRGQAAVWGVVRDSLGKAMPNVPVTANWMGNVRLPTTAPGDRVSAVKQDAVTRTGANGHFLLCHLPAGDLVIESQSGELVGMVRVKIADRDRLLANETSLVLKGRAVR